MGKFDYRELSVEERDRLVEKLADVFSSLKGKKKITVFLERLLSPSEIVMLARRLQVAELLVGGRTYDQIQNKLKVGISTIRSIEGWLEHATRDYQLVRAEQRELKKAREQGKKWVREPGIVGSFTNIRRRDSRWLLINLLLGD